MSMIKSKLAFTLLGALFFTQPASLVFAHAEHCGIKETVLGDTMKYIKSELRAYNKGFKADNKAEMQDHINELIMLSGKAEALMPVVIENMDGEHGESSNELTELQKQQYKQYQQQISEMTHTFKKIKASSDPAEISSLLEIVNQQKKQGHKSFRQNCKN
ncbi:cytochrome b562 [Psychromonas sp. 14N.309.X.WAT.B.A12]|uniref:cytochrome b562 n=1 Tax=unclassified Psychromonas TaxID=2614957 RepID=UPI0025B191E0|nr:cytochrome b562 [Psychromonas sp. 14N.309.X.WAT.B.A12]MDN2663426.1 cytochrome b562 [Psychromonas sp. 14N.309.X.WAT.B.A12]